MSLYYETAPFLSGSADSGSLKSRVFAVENTKSLPNQIFALATEASKWSPILAEVIEGAQLLQHARKLTPNLALLLVHDLLLNKRGISAPSSHPLRLAVEKQKARLAAEFTRARLKRGFASLEQFRADVEKGNVLNQAQLQQNDDELTHAQAKVSPKWSQPRWVRINKLKTSLEDQLETTFSDYAVVDSLHEILHPEIGINTPKILHVDQHIPNLLAFSPGTDLSKTQAYVKGLIILQDKASCFPAHLLDIEAGEHCLDACAAPGNKTSHLAAILHEKSEITSSKSPEIHASERDPQRASVLESMVRKAGASDVVCIHRQDFLKFDLGKPPCNQVSAVLLDPSCSGSGIVGREETFNVTLPRNKTTLPSQPSKNRKRKRRQVEPPAPTVVDEVDEEEPSTPENRAKSLQQRLAALSEFQLRLLLHAFRFPKARKITYSTCSVYAEENENVVIQALLQSHANELGWRILRREEQVGGLKTWNLRGDVKACQEMLQGSSLDVDEIAEACIRCEKGTREGTQGFFVAGFLRDSLPEVMSDAEREEVWEGFDDP